MTVHLFEGVKKVRKTCPPDIPQRLEWRFTWYYWCRWAFLKFRSRFQHRSVWCSGHQHLLWRCHRFCTYPVDLPSTKVLIQIGWRYMSTSQLDPCFRQLPCQQQLHCFQMTGQQDILAPRFGQHVLIDIQKGVNRLKRLRIFQKNREEITCQHSWQQKEENA